MYVGIIFIILSKIILLGGFMKQIYSLTDEECARIDRWARSHDCRYRHGKYPSKSPIGGEISVTFTPTSIGTIASGLTFGFIIMMVLDVILG